MLVHPIAALWRDDVRLLLLRYAAASAKPAAAAAATSSAAIASIPTSGRGRRLHMLGQLPILGEQRRVQ